MSKENLVSTLKSQIIEKATGAVEMTRRAVYVDAGRATGGKEQAAKLQEIAKQEFEDFKGCLDRLCELVKEGA